MNDAMKQGQAARDNATPESEAGPLRWCKCRACGDEFAQPARNFTQQTVCDECHEESEKKSLDGIDSEW
jgi:cytochrome c553